MSDTTPPHYPEVNVMLLNQDPAPDAVIARAVAACRAAKLPKRTIDQFVKQAKAAPNPIHTVIEWFDFDRGITGEE